ncbi:hypothetical protein PL373_06050 [Tenacibaculum maritimum]|nr:hypothetical protein [Tenacibaculum maritimum]MDB0600713.1 hypothetical protein [Tenacibaculum maritimum]MDB0612696.1 hypothetical protein [Tenacibaculum maritimum]
MKTNINIKNLIGTVIVINTKDEDSLEQVEKIVAKAIKGLNQES